MATETMESDDIRDIIMRILKEDDRTLRWLHDQTGVPYGTLYSVLREKRFTLSAENFSKINKVLPKKIKKPKIVVSNAPNPV